MPLSKEDIKEIDDRLKVIIVIIVFSYLLYGLFFNFICSRLFFKKKEDENDAMKIKHVPKYRDEIIAHQQQQRKI